MTRGRLPTERREKAAASSRYKYKLTLEYDGTGFSGWQSQTNARSIQGTLFDAARELFGGEVDLQGAGRTDAGVHALAQVAHLETTRTLALQRIIHGLNDLLPAPINVLKVETAPIEFHARHTARQRSYLYLISRVRTAFGKRYVWWVKDGLDIGRMQAAAEIFRGFHDFASFADRRIDKHVSTEVQIDRTEVAVWGDLIVLLKAVVEKLDATFKEMAAAPGRPEAKRRNNVSAFLIARHGQQLGGESPLQVLMVETVSPRARASIVRWGSGRSNLRKQPPAECLRQK